MKSKYVIQFCFLLYLLSGHGGMVAAQVEIIEFETPQQHELYQKAIRELRCLVCQNQNLADSNADLARDLRRKTSEMIKQGKQYDEIVQYMQDRYGEFVLYRPRVTASTMLLWFSPFVLLIMVIVLALSRVRKSRQPTHTDFSKEELDKAKSLLEKNPSP